MKIALIETSHEISQTVMRSIANATGWDLFNVQNAPNLFKYDAVCAYGILRGTAEILRSNQHWFEIDRGFWDADHYSGNYRISYRGTQPIYPSNDRIHANAAPTSKSGYTLICPPTEHVCEFFGIDGDQWRLEAIKSVEDDQEYLMRRKGSKEPIEWDKVGKLVTFNSSLGFEALKRGIAVISDPDHSTIGSYYKNVIDANLDGLLSFADEHHFKLSDGGKICQIVSRYLST